MTKPPQLNVSRDVFLEKKNAPVNEVPLSEISVDKLIDNCLLALHREVTHILIQSSKGKLEPTLARDLRDHLKALLELKDREEKLLKGLSDEELDQLVNDKQNISKT